MYTVKQISDLAGVSNRTLHYYDEIGLLKPTRVGDNNYRYYDEAALLRLQQILFYREMDLELEQIRLILDEPGFDLVSALQKHRQALEKKTTRARNLIKTVDATIMHLLGEVKMSKKNIFEGFSEEKQKEYEEQAKQEWGKENVERSIKLWNSYSEERKQEIMQEGSQVYLDLIANMEKGPKSETVQQILVRWHEHLHYFYEPSLEVLRGLGTMYDDHPDFNATFTAMHPDLPPFLKEAINFYVDELEDQWLRRELGLLEESE